MNPSKTEFLIVGTCQQRAKLLSPSISFQGSVLTPSDSALNLVSSSTVTSLSLAIFLLSVSQPFSTSTLFDKSVLFLTSTLPQSLQTPWSPPVLIIATHSFSTFHHHLSNASKTLLLVLSFPTSSAEITLLQHFRNSTGFLSNSALLSRLPPLHIKSSAPHNQLTFMTSFNHMHLLTIMIFVPHLKTYSIFLSSRLKLVVVLSLLPLLPFGNSFPRNSELILRFLPSPPSEKN